MDPSLQEVPSLEEVGWLGARAWPGARGAREVLACAKCGELSSSN